MLKYGVCKYNINAYKSNLIVLSIYDTYDDAYMAYLDEMAKYKPQIATDLWIVRIEDDIITKMDQFIMVSHEQNIAIDETNYSTGNK